jgi:hypothetical protein
LGFVFGHVAGNIVDTLSDTRIPSPNTLTAATALQALAPGEQPLSTAARAFNLQLTRVDKLRAQLDELDTLGRSHRVERQRWLAPLQQRQRQQMRDLALALAEHLQGKALSRLQRAAAIEVLCELAQALAVGGDAEMAALHDRHSPRTLAQKRQADAEALRAARAAAQAHLDARAQTRKQRKKPAQPQVDETSLAADADTQLRALFRQLASALHPDREPDEAERRRKTALMSEANTAYARQDLVTLMQIQLHAELADPAAVSRLADDRLAALTLLLKRQVAGLERERAARQGQLASEFDLPLGQVANPNTLRQQLLNSVSALESVVARLEQDLAQVQEPAALKRWLNRLRETPTGGGDPGRA